MSAIGRKATIQYRRNLPAFNFHFRPEADMVLVFGGRAANVPKQPWTKKKQEVLNIS